MSYSALKENSFKTNQDELNQYVFKLLFMFMEKPDTDDFLLGTVFHQHEHASYFLTLEK